LLHVRDDKANDLATEDGNMQLHIEPGSLLHHADAYAVALPTGYVPSPLPPGLKVLGSAYEVRFSGAATGLTKPGLLRLHYHPEVMGLVSDLAIYYWDPTVGQWIRVGGSWIDVDNSVGAAITDFGIYALMGTPSNIFLPNIMK
jgi:hypothetical protein